MEYLRDLYEEDKLKPPVKEQNGKYAYHQPCHLFALGIGQPGVDVLKDRFNINIIPLNAGCCGLAGTFGMQKKNSALSQAISENLRRELGRKNYETVITECSVCAMQIEHISRSKTQHPIKLIEKAYGI
jgi:glycerol-3-phosphate dehydrogenase subunit C